MLLSPYVFWLFRRFAFSVSITSRMAACLIASIRFALSAGLISGRLTTTVGMLFLHYICVEISQLLGQKK
jgi:thiamine transporter ThiT